VSAAWNHYGLKIPTHKNAQGDENRLSPGLLHGAGDGNRTRMTSLEGWGSAIELHPRARDPQAAVRVECYPVQALVPASAL
jgi:hypothetical protein